MNTSGAFLVDKPAGMTSAAVVGKIKRRFRLPKVGHSGTLDPMATGLMVVLFGSATRLQSLFLEGDKSYEGVIRLGVSTDTDDIEGATLREASADELQQAQVAQRLPELIRCFSGPISQTPPSYSAVKVAGKRSYELARKDRAVQLSPRTVEIYGLQLELLAPDRLGYRVSCSKGTYVRSLARDIGLSLEIGGCLESIRRTRSGSFSIEQAVPLEELLEEGERQGALSVESLVATLPRLELGEERAKLFRHGNPQAFDGISLQPVEQAAVFGSAGQVLGLVQVRAGHVSIEAVFNP